MKLITELNGNIITTSSGDVKFTVGDTHMEERIVLFLVDYPSNMGIFHDIYDVNSDIEELKDNLKYALNSDDFLLWSKKIVEELIELI